jgi:DNA-binding PadR family transcriptional regulator
MRQEGEKVPDPVLPPLAVAALALLEERPMHPYEMYQTLLLRKEDALVKVRPGTLYHAVNRMAAEGLVRATHTDREGNRPERTTYEITPLGRAHFVASVTEMLSIPVNHFPHFPLAMAEAHHLPLADVLALVEARAAAVAAERDALDADIRRVRDKGLPERLWLELDLRREAHAAELAWLERLLDRLRSGDLDWNEPVPVLNEPVPDRTAAAPDSEPEHRGAPAPPTPAAPTSAAPTAPRSSATER